MARTCEGAVEERLEKFMGPEAGLRKSRYSRDSAALCNAIALVTVGACAFNALRADVCNHATPPARRETALEHLRCKNQLLSKELLEAKRARAR